MAVQLKAMLALGLLLASASVRAQPAAAAAPVTLSADDDEHLQWSAAVVVFNELHQQGDFTVKLFGASGGDPAMNGLYTYLAFYLAPGDGWRIFKLGDFLSYRVVSESRGRVLLEVNESVMNDASGEIGSQRRRLLVSWTPGANDEPPTAVTVATAN
jgi:hypothetical protein